MAAPIVSGIAALILQIRPVTPPNRVMDDVVNEIEESGYSWKCSLPSRNIIMETARVDAYRAVMNQQSDTPVQPACRP